MQPGSQIVRLAAHMGLEDLFQGEVQKKQPVPNAAPLQEFLGQCSVRDRNANALFVLASSGGRPL